MKEYFVKTKDILCNGICRNNLALSKHNKYVDIKSPEATQWCLVGAIALATHNVTLDSKNQNFINVINHLYSKLLEFKYVEYQLYEHPQRTLSAFNDKSSKQEIIGFIDQVIHEYQ